MPDTDFAAQVGMGNPEVTIPITMLLVKELQVIGSLRYGVRALALIQSDILILHRPVITNLLSLS